MINNALLQLSIRMRMLRDTAVERERDRGATAVEYALLVTLIAIVVIGGATLLGANIDGRLREAAASLGGGN